MTPEFVFMTSVQSVQGTGVRARNLQQLAAGLEKVDGSSIYHHTYRFYRAHSFLGNTPLSDFAFWIGENLREGEAAERMEALDLRDFHSIRDLRNALLEALTPLREDEERWTRKVPPGLEFHFQRSVSLVFPTGKVARNLEQFSSALEEVDTGSLYFHLIEAPLHLDSESPARNDFSAWLDAGLGRPDLARAVEAMDPYRGNLEGLRNDLLGCLGQGRWGRALRNVLGRMENRPRWFRHRQEGD